MRKFEDIINQTIPMNVYIDGELVGQADVTIHQPKMPPPYIDGPVFSNYDLCMVMAERNPTQTAVFINDKPPDIKDGE